MVLPLMTQVMLAGGLLLEVTQVKWTVSPPRASRVPPIVTTSGPTGGQESIERRQGNGKYVGIDLCNTEVSLCYRGL